MKPISAVLIQMLMQFLLLYLWLRVPLYQNLLIIAGIPFFFALVGTLEEAVQKAKK